jgi:Flp pilus assembly pilin Flp
MSQDPKELTMLTRLLQDESGFIVSAELVLIATLCVVGLIVGLSEVQHAVISELNDVADAIGSLNQSYFTTGFVSFKNGRFSIKAASVGSFFFDSVDACDNNQCALDCAPPFPEGPKFFN